jgi:hypothetical protein
MRNLACPDAAIVLTVNAATDRSLAEHGTTLADGLRGPCPVELDNLLSNEFDLPEIVRRIIKSEV